MRLFGRWPFRRKTAEVEELDILTSAPELSTETAGYLVAGNPQLIDLQTRYAAHPASVHSQWSRTFVEDIDLRRFRADNAYIWQARRRVTGQTYVRTAEYVKRADRLLVFDRLAEDGGFGVQHISLNGRSISRDLLDSVLEMNAICEFMGTETLNGMRILDIGAGYGRLAHRIVEAYPEVQKISCTDAIPESTFLCGFYLKFRGVNAKAAVVPLDHIEKELSQRAAEIDLAVNVHSFSECTLASIRWWIELLRSAGVPRLFIVPNFGKRLVSPEPDGERKDFGRLLRDYGYRQVFRRPKFVGAPDLEKNGLYPTSYHGFELQK